jgi:putative NIF3 family GTP cyclohydrolase 1 type 2
MWTLGEIYKAVVELGISADPRGKKTINEELKKVKKDYQELKKQEKQEFDTEKLTNPYADTRILYGDKNHKVKRVLVGIDMEIGEVLVADRLNQRGKRIDLIISHHPEGYALAGFYDVMRMQADVLNKFGVPINVAEGVLKDRISEVERKVMPVNHNRAVDAARLLDIPFICVHTPTDNLVTQFLQKMLDKAKPYTVKDIISLLKKIPEYKMAIADNAGPKVFAGKEGNRAGKVFVEMTGGTEGSKKAIEKLAQAGVGTIVGMHMSDEIRKESEKYHINVIIAGHIASDNLGLNLLLDKLTKKDKLDIITCSGFRRVKR